MSERIVTERTAADAVAYLQDQLDNDGIELRRTTNLGSWRYVPSLPDRTEVRHEPTGDQLARLVYPGDAEHIVRWQPRRIAEEIKAKQKLIDQYRLTLRVHDAIKPTHADDRAAQRRIADALLVVIMNFAEAAGWES